MKETQGKKSAWDSCIKLSAGRVLAEIKPGKIKMSKQPARRGERKIPFATLLPLCFVQQTGSVITL